METVTKVQKFWTDNISQNYTLWGDLTRWCILEFGLPTHGGRWTFHTHIDWMEFEFKDPRDAELFILKWM